MKIKILIFSAREKGNSYKIANIISSNFINQGKNNVVNITYVPSILKGNCSNCSLECLQTPACCKNKLDLNDLYSSIVNSDLVIYLIPNYCGLPNSNFVSFYEKENIFFKQDKSNYEKYLNVRKKFIFLTNSNINLFKQIAHLVDRNISDKDILIFSSSKYLQQESNIDKNEKVSSLINSFINEDIVIHESAISLVFNKGKVLTLIEKQVPPYYQIEYSLPKGHVEKNETHVETAIRETKEEANFILKKSNFVCELNPVEYYFDNPLDGKFSKKIIYPIIFKLDENKDSIQLNKPTEDWIEKVKFTDITEFKQHTSHDLKIELIEKGLTYLLEKK